MLLLFGMGCGQVEAVHDMGHGVAIDDTGFTAEGAVSAQCTICDDPADVGNVPWCDDATCVAGANLHNGTPATAGYCPAMYHRAVENGLDPNCVTVIDGGTLLSSFCNGITDRIYYADDTGCAYATHHSGWNGGQAYISVRWYSNDGKTAIEWPTSELYEINDDQNDRWYQFYEHGVVVNTHAATDAFWIGKDSNEGRALKERYKYLLGAQSGNFESYPTANTVNAASGPGVYNLFTDGGSPAVESGIFADTNTAYLVPDALLGKYEDYDSGVTNPDYLDGYLGAPASEAVYDGVTGITQQLFDNGQIMFDQNGVTTIGDSHDSTLAAP